MTTAHRTREVHADAAAVWECLADFGGISRWAPNVDHSCIQRGADVGEGTVRRVQVGPMTLLEEVIAWQPQAVLEYRIDGLPARLGTITNRWELTPSDTGTEVTLTTSVDAGPRPPQQLVARIIARRLAGVGEAMLDGLAEHARGAIR